MTGVTARRWALLAGIALVAVSLLSPGASVAAGPRGGELGEITAVHAAPRSPVPALRRDPVRNGFRLTVSRSGHRSGLVPALALLALLMASPTTAISGVQRTGRTFVRRHSISLRAPPSPG